MLLNMDFNASLGRHPKRARNGQLVDDAQPVAGAVLCSLSARHGTAHELISYSIGSAPERCVYSASLDLFIRSQSGSRAECCEPSRDLWRCIIGVTIHILGEHNVNV